MKDGSGNTAIGRHEGFFFFIFAPRTKRPVRAPVWQKAAYCGIARAIFLTNFPLGRFRHSILRAGPIKKSHRFARK